MTAEWTVVRQFSHAMEAHMARGAIEASGVPARIRDEHLVSQDWLLSNAVGGVRLEVPAARLDEARAALAEADAAGVQEGPLTCPLCSSENVTTRNRSAVGTIGMVIAVIFTGGLALLAIRAGNHCADCGGRWG